MTETAKIEEQKQKEKESRERRKIADPRIPLSFPFCFSFCFSFCLYGLSPRFFLLIGRRELPAIAAKPPTSAPIKEATRMSKKEDPSLKSAAILYERMPLLSESNQNATTA